MQLFECEWIRHFFNRGDVQEVGLRVNRGVEQARWSLRTIDSEQRDVDAPVHSFPPIRLDDSVDNIAIVQLIGSLHALLPNYRRLSS